MNEPLNQIDPRHPHERDGRNERPHLDSEGRCTVCARDLLDELRPALAAAQQREAELVKVMDEALRFWSRYATLNEPAQDDISDQKNAMEKKMHAALAASKTAKTSA